MRRILVVCVLLCVVVAGTFAVLAMANEKCPKPSQADLKEVAKGNTAFALDLYKELAREDGNIVFSPISISNALAIGYAGARGETATEMQETLHFTLGQDYLYPAIAGLISDLNEREGEGANNLVIANRLWGNSRIAFKNDFLDLLSGCYGEEIGMADFSNGKKVARKINAWAKEQTKGNIEKVVEEDDIGSTTVLVITTAASMKGSWASKFLRRSTRKRPFFLSNGDKVMVDTMYQKETFCNLESDTYKIIKLPYQGQNLSMIAIMPKAGISLKKLESELTPEMLDKWTKYMNTGTIKIYFPKLNLKNAFSLKDSIVNLGMRRAFGEESSDFTGMADEPIWIGKATQNAMLEVDEEGTTAAAVTSVQTVTTGGAQLTQVFKFDHPFMFLIMDKKTGTILFMGRVTDPSK